MPRRLIIPTKQTMAVVGGNGSVVIPQPTPEIPGRILTYISISKTGARKGKIQITDVDNVLVIWRDPKPMDSDVSLDFYSFELRLPLNGPYTLKILGAQDSGDYSIYTVVEERPKNV